ncbi:ATP-dependent DNA helicase RecG [Actinosynnema mirum]|uniref:ATP-dependent DNA helicase RecG n=1 Tax=Actinosynnema mirum (strain ATCC 29888 / DSM 43827 / JCM 3225 / NBRC 14064 / NCIMB 13271 / NRRL B-12336 / IMRU 3971 / 101) TaxID=446462 RepID=C6WF09_ACTMD|nr:ATP-dependent DNA helicase RecG [Actinosynnema mirum]ACU39784.1 ATP-dependent DNA helicase RecG [Actinosynnema mirum DSM 43827]
MTTFDDSLVPLLGQKTADALETGLGLTTVGDLLRHYPRRYDERGKLTEISGLELGEHVTVQARVKSARLKNMRARRGEMLDAVITDGTSELHLVFFGRGSRKVERELLPNTKAMFAGKVGIFNGKLQLAHPDYEIVDGLTGADDGGGAVTASKFADAFIPVYPAAQGIQSWNVAKCVEQVLAVWDGVEEDPLPEELRESEGLITLEKALRDIHRPDGWPAVTVAQQRLKWDEALAVQLALAQRRHSATARPASACPRVAGRVADAFDARLPFELTAGQQAVGDRIAEDLSATQPMNRLLQGEVGSGKTMVALRAMLQVVDSGRQSAMLAPTEVLAAQHARSLRELLGDLGQAGELGGAEHATRVTLLTGSMPAAQRKKALLEIMTGEAGIVVGTHALIQDKVAFADLGLVVVDEQHRFGVEQRAALSARPGSAVPHVLVMTATPIPRTVAMTVYGDLEVSALRELPGGRSPIKTSVVPTAEKPQWLDRAWQRIHEEVGKGHQVYVVCPRIGDGEDEDGKPPKEKGDPDKRPPLAVVDVANRLAAGPLKGLRIDILHGRLAPDDKDAVMRAFAANEVQVLVATTVVEVGVNVPNATVMVIMDADRFGVSQLHQLRGRVGRGSAPGLCLLVSEMPGASATMQRLRAVESTLDGFELAQLDLELRREGDILGAAQSGTRSGLKMLSLLRDEDTIEAARVVAQEIVERDPDLGAHPGLATLLAGVLDEERADYLEKT